MSLWDAWKASRQVRGAAERYAMESWGEPAEEDVRWLAREVAAGDEDRARWELRYLRRALAQLVAERDGLDDRTGAAVATALAERLRRDPDVARERLSIAERQSNLRLSRYRETLRERGAGPLPSRLALALVQLAAPGRPPRDEEPELAVLVERELVAAQERLRDIFGVAALPDDVRPSDALNRR
ncbi:MAG: molybdopterin-binding domain-containing protein [Gemmatimonadaceae bacterium]